MQVFCDFAVRKIEQARRAPWSERNRLLLVHLFAHPANVLVLVLVQVQDDPTNDLEIATINLPDEQLQVCPGTCSWSAMTTRSSATWC